MITTHKELVRQYRELEGAINRALKSARKLKKGEKIKSVRHDRNITTKSFDVLLERARELYPRLKPGMPIDVVRLQSDELVLGKIIDKLSGAMAHVSGHGAKEAGDGAYDEENAIAWWNELIAHERAKGSTAGEIVSKLGQVFGRRGAGLADEIDSIVQAVYNDKSSPWRGSDGRALAESVYERAASVFNYRPGGAAYPWAPSFTPKQGIPRGLGSMYKTYGVDFDDLADPKTDTDGLMRVLMGLPEF